MGVLTRSFEANESSGWDAVNLLLFDRELQSTDAIELEHVVKGSGKASCYCPTKKCQSICQVYSRGGGSTTAAFRWASIALFCWSLCRSYEVCIGCSRVIGS